MNKIRLVIGIALLAALAGCGGDDDGYGDWSARRIWPGGSKPVPSPTGSALLFLQETEPAGLYLNHGINVVRVTADGVPVRSDYGWSRHGDRFAFSCPGQPGTAGVGIFVASLTAPQEARRIWDRGSYPRFLPDLDALICAGPDDGSGFEGIWQFSLFEQDMIRIVPSGQEPEVSVDGLRLAYLVRGGVIGRTLVVLNRETGETDTLAANVLQFAWLGDSRTLVYEINNGGVQELRTIPAAAGQPPAFVAVGTAAAGFSGSRDFVFTAIAGDQTDGLFTAAAGRAPARLWPTGTLARPIHANRIVAQDSAGVFELRR